MKKKDFLFELGTEELPAKQITPTITQLAQLISQQLTKLELHFDKITSYATPRRLAVIVHGLELKQPDRSIEKRGPALQAAYQKDGAATPALLGFARSCQTEINKLEKLETAQGSWLVYRSTEKGKPTKQLLAEIVTTVFAQLALTKPMQWSDYTHKFLRPVQWLVMLLGDDIVPATLFNLKSGRKTYGHRFHHPSAITLKSASEYVSKLHKTGKVIVDINERKELIQQQISTLAKKLHATAIIPEPLLEEVTQLVEWPNALTGDFDPIFLTVPAEVLTAAMIDHQRCFPLADKQKKLLPHFIAVSNIESKKPIEVKRGNERVIRARLADAKFFYEQDKQKTLSYQLEQLKHVVFQVKLGTLYDKSQRIAKLAAYIGSLTQDEKESERAGLICKTDLITAMIGEFPELHGFG